jgi:3-phenylpropionate/trans-cinnamate dioxygenase ferredoxin component
MPEWVSVCEADAIDREDVMHFKHGGRDYAVYRSPEDTFHATDGLCTHEHVSLADGLVIDDIIECPRHNGRFNYKTGEAQGGVVCVHLAVHPVRVEAGRVEIMVG